MGDFRPKIIKIRPGGGIHRKNNRLDTKKVCFVFRKKTQMVNKRILFLGFLLIGPGSLLAQKKVLSLSDAVTGQYRKFKPQSYDFVKAIPGSDDFSFVDQFKDFKKILSATGETLQIAHLDELNKKMDAAGLEALPMFPYAYEWETPTSIRFSTGDRLLRADLAPAGNVTVLADYGGEPPYAAYSHVSGLSAFTRENNLFVQQTGKAPLAVTSDSDKGIVNGSGYTHRQEFGIQEGIFVSPQGRYVAFYRKDETQVTDYPLVNTQTRIAVSNNIKYPMAGMTGENVTLGIYDSKSGKTVFLKTGEPKDQYLTAVTWDPSEKSVYVALLNREQNHLKLNRYSAETGERAQTLFEEKNDKWVEPENPLYFLKTTPERFVWQSERSGYNQLYLYDTNGKLLKTLTTGTEPVLQILGTDPKEETLFYEVSADLALSRKIYRVNLKSGKSELLTPEKGTHLGTVSANGNYLFTSYSSLQVPARTTLLNLKNKKSTLLLDAPNPYTEYDMPRAELVTVTAADGKTVLNGRIIKPADYSPGKKYPVIVYVYGGPHAQLVSDSWLGGAGLWDYYMAQNGYVLFTLDNRGSANRGFEFENVIHRHLGREEMKDQLKGVEYLKTLPYVDASRMGVYGWSFGGFMTTSLLTNYPDVFKAGVAGGPVIDWKWYEIMYGERYMDTPDENPEGYAETGLTDKAKKLKARLLMIHGAQDPVVVQQHSLEFIKACIKEGKPVDYFVYPDHEHNVRGKDRVHLMAKISDYFDLHLKK